MPPMLGLLCIAIMNFMFAATFPLGKFALQYTTPSLLIGLRMLLAGTLFLTYEQVTCGLKMPKKKDWGLFFWTTLFYVYLAFIPEFWALQYLTSFKTNLLWSIQPFVAAALGYMAWGERLTVRKIIALGIGFASVLPLMFGDADCAGVVYKFAIPFPEIALCVAVFSTVYAWVLIKYLMKKEYSLAIINGITMLLGGMFCTATAVVQSSVTGQPLYTNLSEVLYYTVILTVISNIIGYGLYGKLLRVYSITMLSFSGFLCPLFGIGLGCMLGECFSWVYAFSMSGIFIGLGLFYSQELLSDTTYE